MRHLKLSVIAVALWGAAGPVKADPVQIPNFFVAGQPAVASEVNENFLSVKLAVDDNYARTIALSAEDARLGGLVQRLQSTLGIDALTEGIRLSEPLELAPHKGMSFATSSAAPFGIVSTYREYNGVRDEALYYGYNTGPDNEIAVVGEPRLIWNMESNYVPYPGANWMEVNLDYTDSTGVFWKRFLAFYLDRNQSEPDGSWAMVGGNIRLENPINQEQFAFNLSPQDTHRTVFRYGGQSRERLQIGYDGSWIAAEAFEIGPSSQTTPELTIIRAANISDGETAIMLLWRNGQVFETREVEVGPVNSAGPGYRALRIAN